MSRESWLTSPALADAREGGVVPVPFDWKSAEGPIVRRRPCVYLAGTMETGWRDPIKATLTLAGAEVWVPADNPQQSAALYVPADLRMAAEADAVFAYIARGHKARGTHAEMGVAFQNNKPIWLLWDDGPEVYQFSATMSYKVFTDRDASVASLAEFIKSGVL